MSALLVMLAVHAQVITRGPYLQQGTPDSVVIVWRTDVAADAQVAIGPAPQMLTVVAQDPTERTQHEVRITGLAPSTRYFYAVGSSTTMLAGADANHFFITQPPPGTRGAFRAWVVGDSGTGDANQAAVRDAMLQHTIFRRPDIILHMGDMAYVDGTDAEFQTGFFNPYQSILRNTVVWPTMGNHEGHTSDSATQTGPYYDAYVVPRLAEAGGLPSGTEAYYAFDHANVHFVVLDSYESPVDTDSAMMTWLRADLSATAQEWVIAFFHHPPYTMGSHDSDTDGELIRVRENIIPTLEAAGVDLVLCGHSHVYEHTGLLKGAYETPSVVADHVLQGGNGRVDGDGPYRKTAGRSEGTVYLVAGHGGRPVSKRGDHPLIVFAEPEFGSVVLDVDRNVLGLRNVRHDGVVTDAIFLLKGEAIVLGSPNGAEQLLAGSMVDVTWSAPPSVTGVDIELSVDGGATWVLVAAGVPNSGRYAWRVPSVQQLQVLLRVSSAGDASIHDESDAPFSITPVERSTVIPRGAMWRYRDVADAPPADWMLPGFDDGAWSMGAAQLGYGEGDEATVLLDADPNIPSVYFRHAFMLDAAPASATYRVVLDDGAAVWLNGTLVSRTHVSDGLEHAVWASSQSADNELAVVDVMDPALLVEGRNVVAVMVKQVSDTSTDLSFDFSLDVTRLRPLTNRAPLVMMPLPQMLVVDQAWQLTLLASDEDGDVLTYFSSELPEGALLNARTGTLEWTPGAADVGVHAFSVQVRDSAAAEVSVMVILDVTEPQIPDAAVDVPDAAVDVPDAAVELDAAVMVDAATAPDATLPDAFVPDAFMPDATARSVPDAAAVDAASAPPPTRTGCTCHGSDPFSAWGLLAGLLLWGRARGARERRTPGTSGTSRTSGT